MEETKRGTESKFKNFFKDSKSELKKVVWPTQRTILKNTGIVLGMIFVVGIFVALLDMGLLKALSMFMSVSSII